MPIIRVRDNGNNRWMWYSKKQRQQQQQQQQKEHKNRKMQVGGKSYSERVRAKWFCCAFKLGFFQLVCQASLLFKSNLELALTKTKGNYMSQSMFPWKVYT